MVGKTHGCSRGVINLFQLYGGAIRNRFENFSRSKSWNRKNDCVGSDRFVIADGDAPALFLFVTA